MPCTYEDSDTTSARLREEVILLRAMLCGVLTVLDDRNTEEHDYLLATVFSLIDYVEGGFTFEDIFEWWNEHKAADVARRTLEAEKLARESQARKVRDAALAKLSPEELTALGLSHLYNDK